MTEPMEPYACPPGCTTAPCGNYAGAMEDCDNAVDMLVKLIRGETTLHRAGEWVSLNYPKKRGRLPSVMRALPPKPA